jgi:hypothetical protein
MALRCENHLLMQNMCCVPRDSVGAAGLICFLVSVVTEVVESWRVPRCQLSAALGHRATGWQLVCAPTHAMRDDGAAKSRLCSPAFCCLKVGSLVRVLLLLHQGSRALLLESMSRIAFLALRMSGCC